MKNYQLAQINIAKAKENLDSPVMQGFVARLDEINHLADRSPGFIWRLQTEDGDATTLRVFEDPLLIVNMSVWEGLESLQNFVYKTVHVELLKAKKSWFEKITQSHQALWWIPAGHIPTPEEGKEKLWLLQAEGTSELVFNFADTRSPV